MRFPGKHHALFTAPNIGISPYSDRLTGGPPYRIYSQPLCPPRPPNLCTVSAVSPPRPPRFRTDINGKNNIQTHCLWHLHGAVQHEDFCEKATKNRKATHVLLLQVLLPTAVYRQAVHNSPTTTVPVSYRANHDFPWRKKVHQLITSTP